MILNFLKGFNVAGKRKATNFEQKILNGIKIHTIRVDEKKRWKPGMKIHFSTGARSSRYNCFKTGVCCHVQEIAITKQKEIHLDYIRMLSDSEIEELAKNDGFDSLDDFWSWFDKYTPFIGRLIHWTDKNY